ncbi:calcium-binding protein [Geminocystis sp. CENA526]|uniref:calcium-binding protein n=1 Tax=Geminocystis sp. CENA526 TaxID=1355871 RepID=UPI003D6E4427
MATYNYISPTIITITATTTNLGELVVSDGTNNLNNGDVAIANSDFENIISTIDGSGVTGRSDGSLLINLNSTKNNVRIHDNTAVSFNPPFSTPEFSISTTYFTKAIGGENNDTLLGNSANNTLIGGAGDDYLHGDRGDDFLDGGSGNDSLDGGIGDDSLIGGFGNDTLNGGRGFDTAIYDGEFADFSIKVEDDFITVERKVDMNVDTLISIEQLQFTDRTVLVENLPTDPTDPIETLFNDPLFRFQNSSNPGAYLYAGEAESQSVRANYPNFVEEGFAFNVSNQADDRLIRLNRFQNMAVSGAYLYAGETESQSIRQNFPQFKEEGIAFYALSADANLGVDIYRFQTKEGAYIFVGEEEKNNILANFPQFTLEGVAFEVLL